MRIRGFVSSVALATAVVAGAALVSLAPAKAAVIYLAPQEANQIGFAPCCGLEPGGVISGPFGVGNTITFAGSGLLNTVDLFGYAGGGSLPIEVDLYAGTNPNTGALLGSQQVIPTGNGYTTEVLNFGGLAVPTTLTFIVSIVGNSGNYDDSFVNWQQFTGSAPTIGTSGNMWYGSPGSFTVDNSYAVATGASTNTLAVQFNATATPLPSTWTMLIAGFVGLGFLAFRGTKKGTVAIAVA
jgi:hypothetical protein